MTKTPQIEMEWREEQGPGAIAWAFLWGAFEIGLIVGVLWLGGWLA